MYCKVSPDSFLSSSISIPSPPPLPPSLVYIIIDQPRAELREISCKSIYLLFSGGSGDIGCYEDIEAFKKTTGCCSVMVARAAQGNPSVFRSVHRSVHQCLGQLVSVQVSPSVFRSIHQCLGQSISVQGIQLE